MKFFKTNFNKLRRKFGLIKWVFGRIKRVLLIHNQMEEFRAGRIWVLYAGGLINRELNERRLLFLSSHALSNLWQDTKVNSTMFKANIRNMKLNYPV